MPPLSRSWHTTCCHNQQCARCHGQNHVDCAGHQMQPVPWLRTVRVTFKGCAGLAGRYQRACVGAKARPMGRHAGRLVRLAPLSSALRGSRGACAPSLGRVDARSFLLLHVNGGRLCVPVSTAQIDGMGRRRHGRRGKALHTCVWFDFRDLCTRKGGLWWKDSISGRGSDAPASLDRLEILALLEFDLSVWSLGRAC